MVASSPTADRDEVDRLFHALADATRRDIIQATFGQELSVSALARRYPISIPAVQKHVAVLERAGLVARRRQGREVLVSGEVAAIRRARLLLDELEAVWRGRIERIDALLTHPEGGS